VTEEQPTTRELVRIAWTTGIVHSVFWSVFVYSAQVLGLIQLQRQIYEVIVLGSVLWGMFGAVSVLRRERDYIELNVINNLARTVLGVDNASQNVAHFFLDYCWFPASSLPSEARIKT